MSEPGCLATELLGLNENEYVRFIAEWIEHADGDDIAVRPDFTGDVLVDVLVAAAAAYVGIRRYGYEPGWTYEPGRVLRQRVWHPGSSGVFAWSLVHAPASFKSRGILIEEDSLRSV